MQHSIAVHSIRAVALAVAVTAGVLPQAGKAAPGANAQQATSTPPGSGKAAANSYREIAWDDLMPPGWDPMKDFDVRELGSMGDGDPRARDLLSRLREAWDNAPVRKDLHDTQVRLSGYVVPLEAEGKEMRQFLLVPYFGACIHVPPPPANQIVHVVMERPARGVRMMDAVSVSGRIRVLASSTEYGKASYRIDGRAVAPPKR